MNGFESSARKQLDLNLTENIFTFALPKVQKRSYLDHVHFHWRPHSELLPVDKIKHNMKLCAYRCDMPGFLACLLLLTSNVSA